MSSPIDCSSPDDFPDALSSSDTLSDGQSSVTITDDTTPPGGDGPGGRRGRNLLRGIAILLCVLAPFIVVLFAALLGPSNTATDSPSNCPTMESSWVAEARSWIAAPERKPVRDHVMFNTTNNLMGFVEVYEPFLGGKAALLPLGAQPSGHTDDPIGAARDFFDKMGHAVDTLCDSIKQSRADAVDESLLDHLGRRHEEATEKLCRPIADLVSSTSNAYLEVAHALAGPYPEALWMRQVATQLSVMAEQILLVPDAADRARMGPTGDVVGEADYLEANNSAAGIFQAHMGPRGGLPRLNSRFIGALWELRSNCSALREASAALAPVAHSFIVGMGASPSSLDFLPLPPGSRDSVGGDAILFQAHVTNNWLHLESALPVLDALDAAAEMGSSVLVMANYRLQVAHDLLGSLRASCWVQRGAGAGGDVAVSVALAEPRSLHDAVVGVSEQLKIRAMGS